MENAYVSFALGPVVSTVVSSAEYHTLFKLMSIIARLLNELIIKSGRKLLTFPSLSFNKVKFRTYKTKFLLYELGWIPRERAFQSTTLFQE